MDSYEITLSYWAMRARSTKGAGERAHSQKVYNIFKKYGRGGLRSAHRELASLRDEQAREGNVTQFTYSKAADEALRLLSILEGTPKRNMAKVKFMRCRHGTRHVRR